MSPDVSLIDLFDDVVADFPNNVAIDFMGRTQTYLQLSAAAHARCNELVSEHGVEAGDLVAVCLQPSLETVVWILAILRCGAAYVPLDPNSPTARNQLILDDCEPRVVIGGPTGIDPTSPASGPDTPLVSRAASVRPCTTDFCYVIYTSGSTGVPKGVPVTHANVVALFESTKPLFGFTADDVWTLFHSTSFDFSVWEIWGPLLHGGCLVIVDEWTKLSPESFADLLRDKGVTVLNQTPTGFAMVERAIRESDTPVEGISLRYIIFGGERLLPARLRPWTERFGYDRPALVNMYGLTEATVHATYRRVGAADLGRDSSPIGLLLPGFSFRLDGDQAGRGELLVSGPQVTGGYRQRAELTAERFITIDGQVFYRTGDLVDMRSGELVYLGRSDRQVKIRGHRIELGEISAAVAATPEVVDVCVVAFGPPDALRIGCAYAVSPGTNLPGRELRALLSEKLPRYLVPDRFRLLDKLPMTINGKVDVAAVQQAMEPKDGCRSERADHRGASGTRDVTQLAAPAVGRR